MTVDGKENVKEKIKIYTGENYTTYKYIFKNGNSYKETISKWKQRDFKTEIKQTEEDRLDKYGYKIKFRR